MDEPPTTAMWVAALRDVVPTLTDASLAAALGTIADRLETDARAALLACIAAPMPSTFRTADFYDGPPLLITGTITIDGWERYEGHTYVPMTVQQAEWLLASGCATPERTEEP